MKKLLQLFAALTLIFSAAQTNAQVTDGTLSPDWTFTDINGVSQNLYTYLNAGKTVVIDISAAWCGPCWAYHTSGALDQLWSAHGPAGAPGVSASTTDDMMVFLIEGELTNTSQQLHGIYQAPGGYAGSTQGDWTLNTDYPIIDLSSSTPGAVTLLNNYHLTYFPTCVMICPDRTMTEVDQFTAANLYTVKGNCSIAAPGINDAQLMSTITLGALNSNLQACDSVIPSFRLGNLSSSALTSATITYNVDGVTQKVKNWTGNLAPYNNVLVTGVKLGAPLEGQHAITATVSSPNGSPDPTPANDGSNASFLRYGNVIGPLVSESFESAGLPSNWVISNGGSSLTWQTANVGFSSSKSAKLNFYAIPSGDIDYFTLEPMSFFLATAVTMSFDVAYAQKTSTTNDKLEVDFSTNCGALWLPRWTKVGATLATNGGAYVTGAFTPAADSMWRHETYTIPSSYLGQPDVLVRFKGTSAQGNAVYVDNINFSMTTGIKEIANDMDLNVYPNPTAGNATVNFNLSESSNVSICLTNELGQQVINSELGNLTGSQNYLLNTEKLRNGLYFLTIKTTKGTITRKLSVNK